MYCHNRVMNIYMTREVLCMYPRKARGLLLCTNWIDWLAVGLPLVNKHRGSLSVRMKLIPIVIGFLQALHIFFILIQKKYIGMVTTNALRRQKWLTTDLATRHVGNRKCKQKSWQGLVLVFQSRWSDCK